MQLAAMYAFAAAAFRNQRAQIRDKLAILTGRLKLVTLLTMNVGLFGGTFDPIHRGHLALAHAAKEQFDLAKIYFVPASVPPHKQKRTLAPYVHRYAMIVLATAEEKSFVPSVAEAPGPGGTPAAPNYSIDTLRYFRRQLKSADKLFFLIGIDAFQEIAQWHEPEALMRECEFVVASRPGYSLADVADFLPPSMRPTPSVTKPFRKQAARGNLVLSGATVHLLASVHSDISATKIRQTLASGKSLTRYLHPAVAEYIKKLGLYKGAR
jgi:nicotinate-nucleotide adenylyltransferase